MWKIIKKTTFRSNSARRKKLLFFTTGKRLLSTANVMKLGKRLVKRKKRMGVITALEHALSSIRKYINRNINLLLNYTYANSRSVDASTIQTVEKTLMFVIMQMSNFVQKDSGIAISIRYEKQFINIRIKNCRLKHNMRRGDRLIKIISVLQHWIKTQNGYSDYIIDKNRICNFNIYLLRK